MKIKTSAGNQRKGVDVRNRCHQLTLIAYNTHPGQIELERELLSRIGYEIVNGGLGWLLDKLRRAQKGEENAPEVGAKLPRK